MQTNPLPGLAINKSRAIEKLNQRIEKGNELLDINLLSEDELKTARHQFQNWQALNYDILCNIFQDISVADTYITRLGAVINNSASLQTKISWFDTDVKNDVNKLESINERIDFLPEEKSNVSQPKKDIVILTHTKSAKNQRKSWNEKWWGLLLITLFVTIVGGLIVAGLAKYFHFINPLP